jgi:uncharacterized membrane protein
MGKQVSKNIRDGKGAIFSLVVLVLLSVVMMFRQLKTSGYFSCMIGDTYIYTSWASQFIATLKDGVIYPRWTAMDFWGYGSPTFILYPPLAFYMVAFFNVFTGSIIAAMNVTKFISLFFLSAGMFFLVRELYPRRVALLTACFYAVFPYHIFSLYIVGTFASMVSLMWFPPVLLFVYRYVKGGQFRHIVYAGACYGGLILTHLINAYMFTFVLVAFIIAMSLAEGKKKRLIALPLVALTGLLTSSAYILPLIYERRFVNLKAFVGEGGGFRFEDYFILPDRTANIVWSFWHVYHDVFVFYVFFFGILATVFLLQALRVGRIKASPDVKTASMFFFGVSLFTIFLLFGPSLFLWNGIPFFKYIQFPTRWLNITVFAVVFMSASVFYASGSREKTNRRGSIFAALLFSICILLDYGYVSSAPIFTKEELMPVQPVNTTGEHLPAGVDIRKLDKEEGLTRGVSIIRGAGETEILLWKSEERVIGVAAGEPLTLRVRTFNFPGWTAYVDGVRTALRKEPNEGTILVDIPEGKHKLMLRFQDTHVRFFSKLIAMGFNIALLLFVIKNITGRGGKKIDSVLYKNRQGR